MSPLKAYRRWKYKRHIQRMVSQMSELGQEIAQMLREDDCWDASEYTVTHKHSGLQLWIANGEPCFRIYGVAGLKYSETEYKVMLNAADAVVLWPLVCAVVNRTKVRPSVAVLNMLRLSQHKSEKP